MVTPSIPPTFDWSTMFTPAEKAQERRSICNACPSKKLGVCTECGCPLLSKIKVSFTECPLGKWGKVDGTSAPFDGVIPEAPEPDL